MGSHPFPKIPTGPAPEVTRGAFPVYEAIVASGGMYGNRTIYKMKMYFGARLSDPDPRACGQVFQIESI